MTESDETPIDDQPSDTDKGEGAQGDQLQDPPEPKTEPRGNPEIDEDAVDKGEEKLNQIAGN